MDPSSAGRRSAVLMILSAAVFGTVGFFVRRIGLPSAQIALYRALMAILLLGVWLLLKRQSIPLKALRREIPLLFLSGGAMGFNWILLFEAYRFTTVSAATLAYYFAPVIVLFLSALLFRERLTVLRIVCIVLSAAGMFLITGARGSAAEADHVKGVLLGLGAAVFYSAVMLLNRAIRNVGGLHRTFLQFCAAASVLLPYVLLTGGFAPGPGDSAGILCLITVGVVHTGITYCMYFSALKDLPGQTAALLSYIDPLVAVVLSALLGEGITPRGAVGGCMILFSALVCQMPDRKKPPDGKVPSRE